MKNFYLAIETSCDETCAAVIDSDGKILSNSVFSQANIHSQFGGVLPDVASKNHSEKIMIIIENSLKSSNIKINNINKIFVTNGPGLINCLMIGVITAKTIGYVNKIPVYPINHIEGHIASCFIENEITFPSVCLIVSGGHTNLYFISNLKNFKLIGSTIDDAAGEAFDKGAKILGLGYPGGVLIDKLSTEGDVNYHKFPIANLGKKSLNFSFSGLKTSLKYYINKKNNWKKNINSIAASYQEAIVDSLLNKLILADNIYNPKSILIAGGVACNSRLRFKTNEYFKNKKNVIIPSIQYCTDNAAMIAKRGQQLILNENVTNVDLNVFSTSKN